MWLSLRRVIIKSMMDGVSECTYRAYERVPTTWEAGRAASLGKALELWMATIKYTFFFIHLSFILTQQSMFYVFLLIKCTVTQNDLCW